MRSVSIAIQVLLSLAVACGLAACGSSADPGPAVPVPAPAAYQPAQLEGYWLLTGGVRDGQIRTVRPERGYVWHFTASRLSMPVYGGLPRERRLQGEEAYRIESDRLRIGGERAVLRLRILSLTADTLQVEPQVASGSPALQLTFTRVDRARVLELRGREANLVVE
jgi:hypothetical protein